jgi:hypothetical protein
MKVYLVGTYDYEGSSVDKVFLDKAKADAYASQLKLVSILNVYVDEEELADDEPLDVAVPYYAWRIRLSLSNKHKGKIFDSLIGAADMNIREEYEWKSEYDKVEFLEPFTEIKQKLSCIGKNGISVYGCTKTKEEADQILDFFEKEFTNLYGKLECSRVFVKREEPGKLER